MNFLRERKGLILFVLFFLTMLIAVVSGKEAGAQANEGSSFEAASLPVMCFGFGDRLINPLYGYTNPQIDGAGHQSVYPFLEDERTVTVHLLDSAARPDSVSYELRSYADSRLMARGSVDSFENSREDRTFTITFQDILTPDEYYKLDFTVELGNRTAYYHTRVMCFSDAETLNRLLQYGSNMHEDIFSRDAGRSYGAKLETDTQTDKDTLAYVNIHGSYDQLVWGSSGAEQVGDAFLTIEAADSNYLYLHFAFLVQADLSEGLPALFRVREAISLQRNQSVVYLLNYERHMEQLWEFQENSVVSAGFLLGVQETDRLQSMSSPDERYTAFTVAGELYLYDSTDQRLTRIFTFRENGEHPLRTLQRGYELRIMEADNSGSVEFAVYGYMNGGEREGSCGISYCRYTPQEKTVSERMAIEADIAEDALMLEAERLMVKGNDHFVYFIFNEELLVMDISTGETAVLVSREEYPNLIINDSGTAFAWPAGTDQLRPQAVRIVDLENGKSETLLAEEGEFLRPMGFIREDLVLGYGSADCETVFNGKEEVLPLTRFVILDPERQTLYEYAQENVFIDHVEISPDKILIHRFSRDNGKYVYLNRDVMLRGDGDSQPRTSFITQMHPTLKKQAVLVQGKLPSSLRIDLEKIRMYSVGPELTLPVAGNSLEAAGTCFAYGKGETLGVFSTPGEAVRAAGQYYGYVLDRSGELIWCWSPSREEQILEPSPELFEEEGSLLSLTGADLRELYYYLNRGKAVKWISPDRGTKWLIGYEWQKVVLYDPVSGTTLRMTQTGFGNAIARDNNYLWYYK